jgi:hypothetical protein
MEKRDTEINPAFFIIQPPCAKIRSCHRLQARAPEFLPYNPEKQDQLESAIHELPAAQPLSSFE